MSNQSPHQPDDHESGRWHQTTGETPAPSALPPSGSNREVEPYHRQPDNTPARPVQQSQPAQNRWQQAQPPQQQWQQAPQQFPSQWTQPNPAAPQAQPQYDQAFQQAPAPAPFQQGVPAQYDMTAPRKSKTVALILALPFLPTSWLGIHNFYLGQTVRGVLHLVFALIGLVPLLWFVVDPVHFIFIIVELVLIITGAGNYGQDRQGRPLV